VLNVATTTRRADARRLTPIEVDMVLDTLADEAPNAETIADFRSTLAFVRAQVAKLPERRRAIVEAAWFEDVSTREIAARHDLSPRMIQLELQHALAQVSDSLASAGLEDFANATREASKH